MPEDGNGSSLVWQRGVGYLRPSKVGRASVAAGSSGSACPSPSPRSPEPSPAASPGPQGEEAVAEAEAEAALWASAVSPLSLEQVAEDGEESDMDCSCQEDDDVVEEDAADEQDHLDESGEIVEPFAEGKARSDVGTPYREVSDGEGEGEAEGGGGTPWQEVRSSQEHPQDEDELEAHGEGIERGDDVERSDQDVEEQDESQGGLEGLCEMQQQRQQQQRIDSSAAEAPRCFIREEGAAGGAGTGESPGQEASPYAQARARIEGGLEAPGEGIVHGDDVEGSDDDVEEHDVSQGGLEAAEVRIDSSAAEALRCSVREEGAAGAAGACESLGQEASPCAEAPTRIEGELEASDSGGGRLDGVFSICGNAEDEGVERARGDEGKVVGAGGSSQEQAVGLREDLASEGAVGRGMALEEALAHAPEGGAAMGEWQEEEQQEMEVELEEAEDAEVPLGEEFSQEATGSEGGRALQAEALAEEQHEGPPDVAQDWPSMADVDSESSASCMSLCSDGDTDEGDHDEVVDHEPRRGGARSVSLASSPTDGVSDDNRPLTEEDTWHSALDSRSPLAGSSLNEDVEETLSKLANSMSGEDVGHGRDIDEDSCQPDVEETLSRVEGLIADEQPVGDGDIDEDAPQEACCPVAEESLSEVDESRTGDAALHSEEDEEAPQGSLELEAEETLSQMDDVSAGEVSALVGKQCVDAPQESCELDGGENLPKVMHARTGGEDSVRVEEACVEAPRESCQPHGEEKLPKVEHARTGGDMAHDREEPALSPRGSCGPEVEEVEEAVVTDREEPELSSQSSCEPAVEETISKMDDQVERASTGGDMVHDREEPAVPPQGPCEPDVEEAVVHDREEPELSPQGFCEPDVEETVSKMDDQVEHARAGGEPALSPRGSCEPEVEETFVHDKEEPELSSQGSCGPDVEETVSKMDDQVAGGNDEDAPREACQPELEETLSKTDGVRERGVSDHRQDGLRDATLDGDACLVASAGGGAGLVAQATAAAEEEARNAEAAQRERADRSAEATAEEERSAEAAERERAASEAVGLCLAKSSASAARFCREVGDGAPHCELADCDEALVAGENAAAVLKALEYARLAFRQHEISLDAVRDLLRQAAEFAEVAYAQREAEIAARKPAPREERERRRVKARKKTLDIGKIEAIVELFQFEVWEEAMRIKFQEASQPPLPMRTLLVGGG